MVLVKIDYDGNWEDDFSRCLGSLPVNAGGLKVGDIALAGRDGYFDRVRVDHIGPERDVVSFHYLFQEEFDDFVPNLTPSISVAPRGA
jgi:hypothetical protein